MEQEGYDGIVASSISNITYLTDFKLSMEFLYQHPDGHRMFVVYRPGRDKEITFICPVGDVLRKLFQSGEIGEIRMLPYGTDNIYIPENTQLEDEEKRWVDLVGRSERDKRPEEILAEVLIEYGLGNKTIGLDEIGFNQKNYTFLEEKLPNADFSYAYEAFRRVRMVKTEDEIERIKKSIQIIEQAIKKVFDHVYEGVSEKELENVLKIEIIQRGGSPALWHMSGKTRGRFGTEETGLKVKSGDLVTLDVGCAFRKYYSDTGRTAVLGSASPRMKSVYGTLLEGQQKAIDMLKPGVSGAEVFEEAVSTIRKNGLPHYSRLHCGHGIGLDPYDLPSIAPGSEVELAENMVLCVETPYYEFGFGRFQIEDMLLITKSGAEYLTSLTRELRVL
jgi:Xaa-Pro aminopeptidase